VAASLALGSCGSEDIPTPDSLAAAVPVESPLLLEMSVRPQGDDLKAVEAIASRFPGGDDLGGLILEDINEDLNDESNEGQAFSFEEDIDPWLGERIAVSLGPGDTYDAVVVETTDPDAAAATVADFAEASEEDEEKRESAGVTSYVEEDSVSGVVGSLLVIAADEEKFDAVVEVIKGDAESLADNEKFSYESGGVSGEDALGYLWIDTRAIVENEVRTDPDIDSSAEEIVRFGRQAGFDLSEPIALTLSATPETALVDFSVPVTGPQQPVNDEDLLEELPGNAWTAMSCPGCFESIMVAFYDGVNRSAAEDGADPERVQEVLGEFGLERETVFETFGNAAFYLSGSSLPSLRGAAVIEVEDSDDAAEAIEGIAALLTRGGTEASFEKLSGALRQFEGYAITSPELPQPVNVILTDDRLVIAYGERAAIEATSSPKPVEETKRWTDLSEQLGDGFQRGGFVDVAPIISLVEGTLSADDALELIEAKPYLEPLGIVGLGSRLADQRLILRTAVTFD